MIALPDSAPKIQRIDILGVDVSAVTIESTISEIERWISSGRRSYVCITGAHGVIECQSDAELRRIHNDAGLVVPDGMPLVWMCKAEGGTSTKRVYGPDLMRALSAVSAERGYRQFYYGGDDGVAQVLAEYLVQKNPGLQVVGTHTPPFRPLSEMEDAEIVQKINESKADIVWVGLSTPKQERWMDAHRHLLDAPVLLGVGAAFDFIPGLKKQAPRWMQQRGLEWFYRLMSEPRRLWRRYLHIVPVFTVLAFRQLISTRAVTQTSKS